MASVENFLAQYGSFIIFAIIVIFTALTMLYYSKKDKYDPEPTSRLLFAFFLGIISVIPAVLLSIIGLILLGSFDILVSIIVAPVTEEIAKLWFVIYLAKSKEFDGPLDGLIYGAMVGAGFAAAENVVYAYSAFLDAGIVGSLTLTSIRSITQIIGHPLYTGLAGIGVGEWKVGMETNKYNKIWRSMLFHGLWNLSSSLTPFIAMLIGLLIVISINIIFLRRELKRALELDRDAYERGYYDQKYKSIEREKQAFQHQFQPGRWQQPPQQIRDDRSWPPISVPKKISLEETGVKTSSGEPKAAPNFCKICGTKRMEGDRFCRNCGSKLV